MSACWYLSVPLDIALFPTAMNGRYLFSDAAFQLACFPPALCFSFSLAQDTKLAPVGNLSFYTLSPGGSDCTHLFCICRTTGLLHSEQQLQQDVPPLYRQTIALGKTGAH